MASRIGTGAVGTTSATIDSTGAHAVCAKVKWETSGVTLTSVTDSQSNTWLIAAQSVHPTGGEPSHGLAYCLNPTNSAALVVTANFSGAATFQKIEVEAFSSATSAFTFDGVNTAATGTGAGGSGNYPGNAFTTTGAGVVFGGVADFNGLGTITGAGTPTFSVGRENGDSFSIYLLSGSAQTITPNASTSTGQSRWIMRVLALREQAGSASQDSATDPFASRRNVPGRTPYSKGAYRRPFLFTGERIPAVVPPRVLADIGSTRPRAGRGPYSLGRYFRPMPYAENQAAAAPTTQTASVSLGAAVQQAITATAALGAAVQAAQTASASIGAAVQASASTSANVGAVVQVAATSTASLDTAVQAGATAAASLSAFVQAGSAAVVSLQAAVQASAALTFNVGAAISQPLSASANIGAAVSAQQTATASLQGAVQAAQLASASLSAYVQAGTTVSLTLDVAVQQARTGTASLSSVVALSQAATASLGAAVASALTATLAAGAAIQGGRSAAVALSAQVDDPLGSVTPTWPAGGPARIGGTPLGADNGRLGSSPLRTNTRRIG